MTKQELIQRLQQLETRRDRPQGSRKMPRAAGQPVLRASERPTDARLARTRRDLATAERRFANLYHFAPVAFLTLDANGRIIDLNLAAGALLRHEPRELTGMPLESLLEPVSIPPFREQLRAANAMHTRLAMELRFHLEHGALLVARLTSTLEEGPGDLQGTHLCLLESAAQGTGRETAPAGSPPADVEERVAERTAALLEIKAEMELFTASVAHDLRAPLRAMYSYAETLLDEVSPVLDEEHQSYLQRIAIASRRMDQMLQDLLAYSRVSRAELELRPIELRTLLEEAAEAQRFASRNRTPDIRVTGPAVWVLGHATVLGQVFANLLENACKFVAPDRQPEITIRIEEPGETVRAWVEDNGIGMDPASHERIFSLFERLHGGAYSGTGVGLAIAKRAIVRMGGQIGVESEPGRGSRFWVELATTRPPGNEDPPETPA